MDDEILINSVHSKPCLWNYSIPVELRNSLIVKESWVAVKHDLSDTFELDDIMKRWKNLKDSYNKAKKKVIAYIPSGSGADDYVTKHGFRFYDIMKFLNDLQPQKERINSLSVAFENNHDIDESSTSACDTIHSLDDVDSDLNSTSDTSGIKSRPPSSASQNSRQNKKKRQLDDQFTEQLLNILTERDVAGDPVEGFLCQLGDALKRFSYKDRMLLQHKIMGDVLEAQTKAGIYNESV